MNLQNPKTGFFLVFLIFLFVFISTLNLYPLMSPDETRYSQIAREMIQSNDWVVPRLNGLDYFEKPVLGYWAFMASQVIFGESPFSARFSSAIAIGLTSLFIFWFIKRQLKPSGLALFGAFIFLSSILVTVVGRIMLLDSMLCLFTTLTLGLFYLATEEVPGRIRNLLLIGAGFSAGLAFLTKGFIALALIGVVVVPYLFLQKRFSDLIRLGWIPALTCVSIALPWSLMVYWRAPDYWNYFFWVEHVNRFLSAGKDQHPEPIWYFVPIVLLGFFPWSLLLIKRIKFKHWFQSNLLIYLSLWVLGPLVFLSLSSGKLATYVLPIFPALSMWLLLHLKGQSFETTKRDIDLRIGFLNAGLILLAGVLILTPQINDYYSPAMKFKALLIFLSWPALLILASFAKGKSKFFLFGSSHLVFMGLLPILLPPSFLEKKAPEAFLNAQKAQIRKDSTLITTGNSVRPICWFLDRRDVFLVGKKGELAYGLERQRDRYIADTDLAEFIIQKRKNKDVNLVLKKKDWSLLKRSISYLQPTNTKENNDYIFLQFGAMPIHQNVSDYISKSDSSRFGMSGAISDNCQKETSCSTPEP